MQKLYFIFLFFRKDERAKRKRNLQFLFQLLIFIKFNTYKENNIKNFIKDYKSRTNYGILTCPVCGSYKLIRWGFYERNVIYISATKNSVFDFFKTIANELDIDVGACYKTDIFSRIQEEIKRLVNIERVLPIIIIDDAHNLSKEIFLEMKVLFDFEMDSKDYTVIVLSGQVNLKNELSKNVYNSLTQRIIVNYRMQGLSREETKEYMKTRLSLANVENEIFTEDALNALYSCSKASPRRLNLLVLNSLLLGCQSNSLKIDSNIVMDAKGEMDLK